MARRLETAEEPREGQHVVDLVREVTAPRCHHGRMALGMNEAEEVNLFLGVAQDHGATYDQIPGTLPAVGHLAIDGIAKPGSASPTTLITTSLNSANR
jgi:hypothetical protein